MGRNRARDCGPFDGNRCKDFTNEFGRVGATGDQRREDSSVRDTVDELRISLETYVGHSIALNYRLLCKDAAQERDQGQKTEPHRDDDEYRSTKYKVLLSVR